MKFSYPSTFIIPCSSFGILFYGSLCLCVIISFIYKNLFTENVKIYL